MHQCHFYSMHHVDNSAKHRARDGGIVGGYNGVGLVKTSQIFAELGDFFLHWPMPFDRI